MPIVDHLKIVPLFQGMTDQALDAVAALASEVEIERFEPARGPQQQ